MMPLRLDSLKPEDLKLASPLPLTRHPAAVYISGLSSGSQRTIRYSLNKIAALLTSGECDAYTIDWSKLRYHHTAAVRVALINLLAPVTANKMLSALRRVLLEAYRLDLMAAEDYNKAVDFANIPGDSELRGRSLANAEIAALLETCSSSSPINIRDAAIVAVLLATGLRRSELVNLDLSDLNLDKGELLVRKGKRGKNRKVYLLSDALSFVEKWLTVRGDKLGPCFCRIRRGGHLHVGRMHPDAIWRMLRHRAEIARLESFSPHDLRRTFCSDLLDAGVDVVTVQKLAGHTSPTTTAKYDRRGEETLRRAVQTLKIPGGKRKR
ncbi:integrase [Gloeocapsopsis sp. AAB1 = 1H9]|uniref:Integrase n=1 Tax=Gloeocapsopsis dulcis AAB1 = 1H9 TaxID=1433147 RepID=A0A6N8G1I3_9CHRO|nr:integrase [Gloeocapsopsis dulcis AAB1 = 1H9]